jgi:hypothetical protein
MHHKETGYRYVEFNWLSTGSVVGSCEHGNEAMGPIKGGKFHQLSYYRFRTKELVENAFKKQL